MTLILSTLCQTVARLWGSLPLSTFYYRISFFLSTLNWLTIYNLPLRSVQTLYYSHPPLSAQSGRSPQAPTFFSSLQSFKVILSVLISQHLKSWWWRVHYYRLYLIFEPSSHVYGSTGHQWNFVFASAFLPLIYSFIY
jgi:hypothetical protein